MCGVYLAVAFMHYAAPAYLQAETEVTGRMNAEFLDLAASYGMEARPLIEPKIDYVSIIERAALRHGFSESYGRKVASHESGFNPRAKSGRGAVGLMQVMPANAKLCGLKPEQLWDAERNADCGFKILRANFDHYRDARKALLSYNGGDEAVRVVTKCGDNTACMGGYVESYAYSRDILNDVASDMRG
jgi:soluble lytic murein transglycosylase-like protein